MMEAAANAARGQRDTAPDGRLPAWVPQAARHYLVHVTDGVPMRALARDAQVHASTILRQVRRLEQQRDDPLVDEALQGLARHMAAQSDGKDKAMTKAAPDTTLTNNAHPAASGAAPRIPPSETRILREGMRVLRRLNEAHVVLAVARDMEMGVVVREVAGVPPERLAIVARDIAQAMALKDWIACADPAARIIRYRITGTGRQELRRTAQSAADGMREAPARFHGAAPEGDRTLRHMRSLLGDSPVTALARRRDRDGRPFLERGLIATAERLREDFELSQAGIRPELSWDGFITASMTGLDADPPLPQATREARDRLLAALNALGPGLADAALRCCCFLEGLESVEEQMNWSARSGKVVLRIALEHLRRHYEQRFGPHAPPIG